MGSDLPARRFDRADTERAFLSDAYRAELGWGPKELFLALDEADGFDERFGTVTAGLDFETPPANYGPALPRMFRHIFSTIDIRHEEFDFVDVGAGKGRALLLASDYPFRRCVGVELAPQHTEIARQNIARYVNPARRCKDIEVVCADATTFEYPAHDLVIWFFQSFPLEPITRFLSNIERSLLAHPRRLILVYANPGFPEPFDQCQLIKRWGKQGGPSFAPFIAKDGVFPYAVYSNL